MHHLRFSKMVWSVVVVLALVVGLGGWAWYRYLVASHVTAAFGTTLGVSGKLAGQKGNFTVADTRQPGGIVIIANSLDDSVSTALTPLIGKTVQINGVTRDTKAPVIALYLEQLNGRTIVEPDQLTRTSETLLHPHVDAPVKSATFDGFSVSLQACLTQAFGTTDAAKAFFDLPGSQTDKSAIVKVNACLAKQLTS